MINLKGLHLPNPTALWNRIDLNRRAAVLAMIYNGVDGRPNCLLTTRSGHISYGGDAAFPGGKADFIEETPLMVARRETFEEIGLALDFQVQHVLTMPAYLSSRYLCVVPEVVWLKDPDIEYGSVIPRIIDKSLFSHEVYKAFSTPLSTFLSNKHHMGKQANWGGIKYNQHYFDIPVREKKVGEPAHTVVWGLTARILIDIARLWFQREPEFVHRKPGQIGDQQLVEKLADLGFFHGPRPDSIDFARELGDSSLLEIRGGTV